MRVSLFCLVLVSALGLLLLPSGGLRADTVYLRNGVQIYGRIVHQDQRYVRIKTETRLRTISKQSILRVEYNALREPPAEENTQRPRTSPANHPGLRNESEIRNEIEKLNKDKEIGHRPQSDARKPDLQDARDSDRSQSQTENEAQTSEPSEKPNRKKPETEIPDGNGQDQKRKAEESSTDSNHASNIDNSTEHPLAFRPTPEGALWRSALFPGWGQWYAGHRWRGGMYAVLFSGATFALYDTNRLYRAQASQLESQSNPFSVENILLTESGFLPGYPTVAQLGDPAYFLYYREAFAGHRSTLESRYHDVRIAGASLAFIYMLNLMDAYFFSVTDSTVSSAGKHPGETEGRYQGTESRRLLQALLLSPPGGTWQAPANPLPDLRMPPTDIENASDSAILLPHLMALRRLQSKRRLQVPPSVSGLYVRLPLDWTEDR